MLTVFSQVWNTSDRHECSRGPRRKGLVNLLSGSPPGGARPVISRSSLGPWFFQRPLGLCPPELAWRLLGRRLRFPALFSAPFASPLRGLG